MLKNFKKNNNKGFTLVELLVVIAIIGILAVVAVPSLMKNINRAKGADVVSYVSAVKTAVLSEYAATTTDGTYDVDALVDDKPADVTNTTASIASGVTTIDITIDSANTTFIEEVKKQIKSAFDTTSTDVIIKVNSTQVQ